MIFFIVYLVLHLSTASDICFDYNFSVQLDCPDNISLLSKCSNPTTSKVIYVFGEIAVGKSTLINFLTGNIIEKCFDVGQKLAIMDAKGNFKGETDHFYDQGCYKLLSDKHNIQRMFQGLC